MKLKELTDSIANATRVHIKAVRFFMSGMLEILLQKPGSCLKGM